MNISADQIYLTGRDWVIITTAETLVVKIPRGVIPVIRIIDQRGVMWDLPNLAALNISLVRIGFLPLPVKVKVIQYYKL